MNFIFKWWLVMYKSYLLFSVRAENHFFKEYFAWHLTKDVDTLTKEFDELKVDAEKNHERMSEIQSNIVKVQQINQRINQSDQVERELLSFIDVLKKM